MRHIILTTIYPLFWMTVAGCAGDEVPDSTARLDGSTQNDAGTGSDVSEADALVPADRATCTITIESDTGGDGSINTIRIEHVTSDGRVLLDEIDQEADGTIEQGIRSSYDRSGNVVLEEVDTAADGTVEFWMRYEYDDAGNRTLKEKGAGDVVESRTTYRFDERGNVTEEAQDTDADGETDSLQTLVNSYDDGGRLVRVEVDVETDGMIDRRSLFTYDGDGRLAEVRLSDLTGGFAGLETFTQYFYADDGKVSYSRSDADGDGEIDTERRFTYEDGRLTRLEWKSINVLVPETISVSTVSYEGTCSPDYEPELF